MKRVRFKNTLLFLIVIILLVINIIISYNRPTLADIDKRIEYWGLRYEQVYEQSDYPAYP